MAMSKSFLYSHQALVVHHFFYSPSWEMSSKMDFVRGVRPCVIVLRVNTEDGHNSWDCHLNAKSPQHPLCFSVFQDEVKDAITISQSLAFLHFGFTSNCNGSVSRHEFDTPNEITFAINFADSEVLQQFAVDLPCYCSSLQDLLVNESIQFNQVLALSYDHMFRDRTVVLIGLGYYSKRYLFEYVERIKAHIVLLDDIPPPDGVSHVVKHYIKASLYEPASYDKMAKHVAAKLKELNVEPFSVFTLCDDYVPFWALLTTTLRQEGILKSNHQAISYENALRNKDKIKVYNIIEISELHLNNTGQHSIAPNAIILTDKDVPSCQIECPHIMKLSTSCGAYGCMLINSTKDIEPAYKEAKKMIANTSIKDLGFGMCFDVKIFLSELYRGSEHDLEIIMNNGKPVFHIFSDNDPVTAGEDTDGFQFFDKGCVMPSQIIQGEKAEEILSAIIHVLLDLDLSHGVFNVEFILTTQGIKIIDINQRPGGHYINEWINIIAGVCTFMAEVILRSELEYFVEPLVNWRSITGYNVMSKEQLTKEMARYDSDTRCFYVQDPDKVEPFEVFATVYKVV